MQTIQTTDIKDFFQKLLSPQAIQIPTQILQMLGKSQMSQTSQSILNTIESSITLGTTEEEEGVQFRNSSPIDMNNSTAEREKMEKENWDLKTYICSLSTRKDMDQYVHRLESSYKMELQELKSFAQNTQKKVESIDTRVTNMEQKLAKIIKKRRENTGTKAFFKNKLWILQMTRKIEIDGTT